MQEASNLHLCRQDEEMRLVKEPESTMASSRALPEVNPSLKGEIAMDGIAPVAKICGWNNSVKRTGGRLGPEVGTGAGADVGT